MRDVSAVTLSLLLVLLLSGCCGPRNLFVLLPDEDGQTGRIAISNQAGSQEIAAPYQMSGVSSAQTPPAAPKPVSQAEVQSLFGPALGAQPQAAVRFLLYFEAGSTNLTAESAGEIEQILRTAVERAPADVSVVGHSDTVGPKEVNAQLALARANEIGNLLVDKGVAREQLEITSHGEVNLLIPTADEVSEPRNRRVEVRVR